MRVLGANDELNDDRATHGIDRRVYRNLRD
jgi:hypothetical protein